MYGRAVGDAEPARFYDFATYNDELARLLGPGYPGQNWPNPPTALVVMAPFGLLAYFPALIAWFAIGLLAFYLAGRREVSDWRILAVVLVSPAALFCVISGQSSFLTTAALLAIFASLDKRPVIAGVLIGLLTVKPQLGVLFPFALIASGRWRVFLWAAVTDAGAARGRAWRSVASRAGTITSSRRCRCSARCWAMPRARRCRSSRPYS